MKFFNIEIQNSKILIEIKNDDYSIFNRIIFWLEKFSEYNYFPNIVDIDYINKKIECDFKSPSSKKLRNQIQEIESILKNHNCQLNNLDNDSIVIRSNTIIIINLFWCIDISIDINQDINYWKIDDNSVGIARGEFSNNRFILKTVLDSKGINMLLDDIMVIIFSENYEKYLEHKKELSIILNYCNYIVINNNNDVYKLKSDLNELSNKIDIIYNNSNNIFENIDLFKFICNSNVDKRILININISDKGNVFYDTKKILECIKDDNDIGCLYNKNKQNYIGIYGDLDNCLEIQKICYENNIDFSNYISDDNEYIDWESYNYGETLKSKKMHWIKNYSDPSIKLPIKTKFEELIPQTCKDNNFAIDFKLYKNFFKTFKLNPNYSITSYRYFFHYLIAANNQKYKYLE